MNYKEAKEFLAKCSQEHLLAFWGELDKAGREALLAQISRIDKDDLAYCQKALAKGQAAPDTKGGKAPKVAVLKGAKLKEANLWLRDEKLTNKGNKTYKISIP